jgi:hypothetical protein
MPAFIFDPIISPPLRRILPGLLFGRRREFARDARTLASCLDPPLIMVNPPPEVPPGGVAVIANHYMGPDFKAWWLALAISSCLDAPVAWVVTREWGYPDLLRRLTVTPITRLFLRQVARSYGFFLMPPMPPKASEIQARASAVKHILRHVAQTETPILGLALEGADSPTLALAQPPPGIGRFLIHLARRGMRFLPAAVYQDGHALCLRFGAPFALDARQAADDDCAAADVAMRAIARLLPDALKGAYA